MGQYFIAVNKTKQEWIHPHRFGDGLKFLEFTSSGCGFLSGLAFLLRQSDQNDGLADTKGGHKIVGSWAGDKVCIVGDYDESTLYTRAMDSWDDVSADVLKAMAEDPHLKGVLKARLNWQRGEMTINEGADQD